MKSPFDLLPSITGDKLPFEPYPGATSVIGLIFQNTDTTYKFFWFLSVLHKTKVARFRTDLQLEIRELAREMIAHSVAVPKTVQALVWTPGSAPTAY